MKKPLFALTLFMIGLAATAQTSYQDSEYSFGTFSLYKTYEKPVSPLLVSNDEKQIKKGDMILSGSASLYARANHYESGSTSSTTSGIHFGIYPSLLFFVSDGLAIGTSLTAGFSTSDGNFSYDLGLGPELRYYFNFGLFIKARASYEFEHYVSSTYNTFSVEPAIGYAIFLNPHVALEPCFFYNLNFSNYDYTSSTSSYINHVVGFEIGLSIFL
ncbi:MAG: hypothetical protein NT092_10895 [Bacteroidia bacterium]|nr:hypothetical protein [Bacteroidia bacterium]